MSKHKLSKTVLEMKFMKKTKIQQEKVRKNLFYELRQVSCKNIFNYLAERC